VLESEKREEEKDLAGAAKTQLGLAHRTVRWCTGQCPVSQRPPEQRSAAQSAGDAWPAPTVGWGHRTVRCANHPGVATVGCANLGRRSAPDMLQCQSGGAPDCPVPHPTEGKNCLPCWLPTAPSCLGAIKGTPRLMEE
jgi:hypothetical protein